ncbi:hypothetical protein WJX81_002770 [Elliptochloris bilobata]|uniref:FAD dependent oxidoreductase domain-containing protein n=1 Tax=Elliptochloris bilobata TaxID=381761 RepID=A0AAW1RMH3_9CHLO
MVTAVSAPGGKRVCVLGAGVIGLSAALRISTEVRGVAVTLVADKFGRGTTSDGSGGLWEPYKLGDTPAELVNKWGAETYQYLQDLYYSEAGGEAGVTEVIAHQLWTQPGWSDPVWRDVVPHFHHMSARELARFNAAGRCEYSGGYSFTTLLCEQRRYLPWLTERVLRAGVTLAHQTITSLRELAGYDLVVNCTGLGAKLLFGDEGMYPVRGHVIRVRAPWVKANYFVDEDNYILPNLDTVVLGGTAQYGDTDLEPREEDRRHIWEGVLRMMPSLRGAPVEREWVGLRPGRDSVRLEAEDVALPAGDGPVDTLSVIHCYGHGGAGVTLHWGCAADVVRLAEQRLATMEA